LLLQENYKLPDNYKDNAELKMKLVKLRWKRERNLKEMERKEAKFARLKDACRRIKEAMANDE
jgi:hypothetical protein